MPQDISPSIEPRERLDDLVRRAVRAGADAADAVMFESASLSVAQRLGVSEGIERAESQDLGLRVFRGRRQAVVSSTDVSADALAGLIERAMAMAGAVPEDPFCGLADRALLAADVPDLDLADAAEPTPEALVAPAAAAEDAARAVAGVTNSEGAEASWSRARVALVTSDGFGGGYGVTQFSIGASVIVGEGTAMERDHDHASARFAADLADAAAIGRSAGERAVARLGPRKAPSGTVPVVYDPRVSRGLLGHLASAIGGPAIARGTSFLKDRMGEAVFADGVTITDDARRPRGLRSKPVDGEGVTNRRDRGGRCHGRRRVDQLAARFALGATARRRHDGPRRARHIVAAVAAIDQSVSGARHAVVRRFDRRYRPGFLRHRADRLRRQRGDRRL